MVENDQKPGAAQPVGEHHAAAMHGTHLAAGTGADQYAVPLGPRVGAARGAVAGDQAAIDRPGQLAARLGERPVMAAAGADQWAAARAAGGGSAAALLLARRDQGPLPRLFGFPRLAGQGFFDGFQDPGQLRLLLLAGLELVVAGGIFLVEFTQGQLTLLARLGELLGASVQGAFVFQQQVLLVDDVLLDVGQLAQGFVEGGQLLHARFAEVVVIGQGAREFFRILLVQQQLQVFLAAALVGGAGLNADQSLLLEARVMEFFFLLVEAADFLFAVFQAFLQLLDLLFQLAHFGFGLAQVFLHPGFFLLQLLQQLLQLGHIAAGGFQLFLGVGFLVGKGRSQQAGEEHQG
ncbi:hypothetical protein D3C85_674800 [compost metagenome]